MNCIFCVCCSSNCIDKQIFVANGENHCFLVFPDPKIDIRLKALSILLFGFVA
ncbi:hypothetical protein [sulfur-oxidizing endosymbiont of Gigantopelta aegis]|uniref:hypothetical protein n=1 Tax=sulfur-oxidizing endosymbiont of Gigantopelta aegis TaxID=2794934 RepID=UPI001BE4539C|nr:hypothetical protein [sulfur-oxidizing endosymbiont of Gigantopelta aegis]